MEQKWNSIEADGYMRIENGDGKTLGIAKDSKVAIVCEDGYAFKNFWERESWFPTRTGDYPMKNVQKTWLTGLGSKILPV